MDTTLLENFLTERAFNSDNMVSSLDNYQINKNIINALKKLDPETPVYASVVQEDTFEEEDKISRILVGSLMDDEERSWSFHCVPTYENEYLIRWNCVISYAYDIDIQPSITEKDTLIVYMFAVKKILDAKEALSNLKCISNIHDTTRTVIMNYESYEGGTAMGAYGLFVFTTPK